MGGAHRGVDAVSLSHAIRRAQTAGRLPVMGDIKPVSPRDGDLLAGRPPAQLAADLKEAGACALSVVTEEKHFGGSCETLRQVCEAVTVPVLRKDFLTEPEQLQSSVAAGASAVLLILATVSDRQARDLYAAARDLDLEPVVEVHSEAELEHALQLSPSIVGINNRDILQLETDPGDVATTERLAPRVPDGVVTLSESSLLSDDDVRRALAAGADAVLIGTMLLQASDPTARLMELTHLQVAPQ